MAIGDCILPRYNVHTCLNYAWIIGLSSDQNSGLCSHLPDANFNSNILLHPVTFSQISLTVTVNIDRAVIENWIYWNLTNIS
jgi:hypothetical protein